MPRPLTFLSCLRTKHLIDMRGYDEDYTDCGFDDNDLADRLIRGVGLIPTFRGDLFALHQWHTESYGNRRAMQDLYNNKTSQWAAGKISHIRNLDKEWGQLEQNGG